VNSNMNLACPNSLLQYPKVSSALDVVPRRCNIRSSDVQYPPPKLQFSTHYRCYSTRPILELGPLGPWAVTITALRIRRPRRMPDWLTLFRAPDPGSSSLCHVCVFPCRRMCHAMPCPRQAHADAHIMPEHLIPTCP
jgi:hypothetical protein